MEACTKNGIPCAKYPDSCPLCINKSLFVKAKTRNKLPKLRQYKKSNRMGASFEEKVNEITDKKLSAASDLTPNSGAGFIKGDIEISGCIDAALELKTKVKPKITRGSLSFTIQKEWLIKLKQESEEANKEFWALVFSFYEDDSNIYTILEYEQLSNMLATMAKDRIRAKKILSENKILEDTIALLKSELIVKEQENLVLQEKLRNFDPDDDLLSMKLDEITGLKNKFIKQSKQRKGCIKP